MREGAHLEAGLGHLNNGKNALGLCHDLRTYKSHYPIGAEQASQ